MLFEPFPHMFRFALHRFFMMLISSLTFADALNAYECLLELRIDTPAPLSSASSQKLIVRISMADIPPNLGLSIDIEI